MKRRPSAGEQPDPGVGLEGSCVQKVPARQRILGWPLLSASLPDSVFTDITLVV